MMVCILIPVVKTKKFKGKHLINKGSFKIYTVYLKMLISRENCVEMTLLPWIYYCTFLSH